MIFAPGMYTRETSDRHTSILGLQLFNELFEHGVNDDKVVNIKKFRDKASTASIFLTFTNFDAKTITSSVTVSMPTLPVFSNFIYHARGPATLSFLILVRSSVIKLALIRLRGPSTEGSYCIGWYFVHQV